MQGYHSAEKVNNPYHKTPAFPFTCNYVPGCPGTSVFFFLFVFFWGGGYTPDFD
jgi:hypothetical protein